MSLAPFWPGATSSITATTTTSNVALARAGTRMRICNTGTVAVFVSFGDNTITATTSTGLPILPGTSELFTISQIRPGAAGTNIPTYFAAITASGSALVSVTVGEGDS